jgi:arsenite oxidase small subunit
MRVGKAASFRDNVPVAFSFPDGSSPCAIVKMGKPTPGGVGPKNDIVAYSTMCTHMGCPVSYDTDARTFKCPCHYTMFDAELSGQMVCGHATENLPQIVLEYDAESDVVQAVGVNGKIYGRQSNVI